MHIVVDASETMMRLPWRTPPVKDMHDELEQSARHIREAITTMPRTFRSSHDGGIWTPVKLLRRLAWHERVELVFLRRRLHAPR